MEMYSPIKGKLRRTNHDGLFVKFSLSKKDYSVHAKIGYVQVTILLCLPFYVLVWYCRAKYGIMIFCQLFLDNHDVHIILCRWITSCHFLCIHKCCTPYHHPRLLPRQLVSFVTNVPLILLKTHICLHAQVMHLHVQVIDHTFIINFVKDFLFTVSVLNCFFCVRAQAFH